MNSQDNHNPVAEAEWLVGQRCDGVEYLQKQGVDYASVSIDAHWFVAPYVSIWRIESSEGFRQGAVAGDHVGSTH